MNRYGKADGLPGLAGVARLDSDRWLLETASSARRGGCRGRGGGWPLSELLIAAAVAALVLCGRRLAARAFESASADERLVVAASAGDRAAFDAALADGASPRWRDAVGGTALMQAACTGGLGMARRLLDGGADVNAADKWGQTPLMLAGSFNKVDLARLLLERGADPSRRDCLGQTALDRCMMFDTPEAAEFLAEHTPRSTRRSH